MGQASSDLAIALVSGGMDSLVSLAMAVGEHGRVASLHLNYGQRTQDKELECFARMSDHYAIPRELRKVVDMGFLKAIGGSSLTDQEMPVRSHAGEEELCGSGEIPNSYVPFRNTLILALAVSWAEVIGAKKIYIGAVEEDSSGYPDCRASYYRAFNALIREGTKAQDIEVVAPVIAMDKKQIVEKAMELKAPIEYSWSCYQRSDRACGVCDSCVLRLRGFRRACVKDPIPYADKK